MICVFGIKACFGMKKANSIFQSSPCMRFLCLNISNIHTWDHNILMVQQVITFTSKLWQSINLGCWACSILSWIQYGRHRLKVIEERILIRCHEWQEKDPNDKQCDVLISIKITSKWSNILDWEADVPLNFSPNFSLYALWKVTSTNIVLVLKWSKVLVPV